MISSAEDRDHCFEITVFDSLYDNTTHKTIRKSNWNDFKRFFRSLSQLDHYANKSTAPLISPAIYKEDTRRSNANVKAWGGWCALDVDSHPFKSKEEIQLFMKEKHSEKAHICYSTASSSIEKPKFRLVFPLSEWITDTNKIQKFWYSLNKEFDGLVDKQTKDVSRMYFIPAKYKESNNNFFWVQEGQFLDADLLIQKYESELFGDNDVHFLLGSSSPSSFIDQLPEKMRESVLKYREQQLKEKNKHFSWTSYKDCPFVFKGAVDAYREIAISGKEGRYRQLYVLMVSIAGTAISKGYPITSREVIDLVLEIDSDIDGYYSSSSSSSSKRKKNRKVSTEAERAISYAYRTGKGF